MTQTELDQLQLDLLVDGELPERDRSALLARLSAAPPSPWKDVAIRFLQRQVEKEAVRKLMAGGSLVPVDFVPELAPPPVAGRIGWRLKGTIGIAAGLLIAVVSATITFYAMRPAPVASHGQAAHVAEFEASIPPEAVSFDRPVRMPVPLVDAPAPPFFFPGMGDPRTMKRSWVIQPNGHEKAVVYPVNTLRGTVN